MKPLIKNEVENRVNELLSQMTLQEKIGQTNQVHAFDDTSKDSIQKGEIGSILNASGALTGQGQSQSSKSEITNQIQRYAVQESRLGIPILFGRDVIHGYRTIFPIPLGQAAAWNPLLVENAAKIAASEATADGIKWTFAPMIDVTRDPRWGRVAEGQGEDPYLSSTLATAMVHGFQGDSFADPLRLVACAKHFVGYGASEGGRDYDGAEISMHTLREIYLPPYKAAVDAGVATVMAAFHDLNGTPMSGNRALLHDLLRLEYEFDGFVVSDWASVAELVNHGVVTNRAEAAFLGLHAGVDMDMVSQVYIENLAKGIRENFLSIEDLDNAVRRILRIKILAGLFENPYTDTQRASKAMLTPDNKAAARQLARESIVLLKNNHNILPLKNFKRIAVIGPMAHAGAELFGTWSPDGKADEIRAIEEVLPEYAPDGMQLKFSTLTDEAVHLASESDAALVIVGESPRRSGENANVATLDLPTGQTELIRSIADQGIPIVLVVIAGRPLAITREAALSQGVLYFFHPGTEGAAALGEIIFGDYSPSGKLPISMPRTTGQIPVYYNHKNSGRPTGQGGFHSRYVDITHKPAYPFGFGLSYSNFEYSNLELSSHEMSNKLNISVEVMNSGSIHADEIVQLYIRDLVGSVTRPVKQLKKYNKSHFRPGESKKISFELTHQDLEFPDSSGKMILEPGDYQLWVGPHCLEGMESNFKLK